MRPIADCHHTLHAVDAGGRLTGSWQDVRDGDRIKVTCRACGKFYGYRSEEYVRQQLEYERRYREQIARQSCPGCGEVPMQA